MPEHPEGFPEIVGLDMNLGQCWQSLQAVGNLYIDAQDYQVSISEVDYSMARLSALDAANHLQNARDALIEAYACLTALRRLKDHIDEPGATPRP